MSDTDTGHYASADQFAPHGSHVKVAVNDSVPIDRHNSIDLLSSGHLGGLPVMIRVNSVSISYWQFFTL